ncbi:DUF397 domain-containing protein (plasmid) [Streptomyces sp. NBC_01298]|uniref:DUF397 domain-containing protein n=1 Tax=Streptomyces sp. NBC_01298 TaxID=2903817 RepID=UPI002E0D2B4A|nr:DUF397 domain-containing protein [Streptomyces sp. NBC_01298]
MSKSKPTAAELDLSDIEWVVSSYSGGGGDCVRVGTKDGFALVGDTKNPDLPPLVYTPSEARAWLQAAKAGEFDFLLDL